MKKFNRKPADNLGGDNNWSDTWKRKDKAANSGDQNERKGVQCFECEGYGHIQVECPNYVRKQTKSYYTTHSDEEEEYRDTGEENYKNSVAFTSHVKSGDTVTPTVQTLRYDTSSRTKAAPLKKRTSLTCREQYHRWSDTMIAESMALLKEKNMQLHETIRTQQRKIEVLEGQLRSMTKEINILNSDSRMRNKILIQGEEGSMSAHKNISTHEQRNSCALSDSNCQQQWLWRC